MANDNSITIFKSEITKFLNETKLGQSPTVFSSDREAYEVNKQLLNDNQRLDEIIRIINHFQSDRGEDIEQYIARLREDVSKFSKEKIHFGSGHFNKVFYFLDHYVEFSKIKIPTREVLNRFSIPFGSFLYLFPSANADQIDDINPTHLIGLSLDRLGTIDLFSQSGNLKSATLKIRMMTHVKLFKPLIEKLIYKQMFSQMSLLLALISPSHKDAQEWLRHKLDKIFDKSYVGFSDYYHNFDVRLSKSKNCYIRGHRELGNVPFEVRDLYYSDKDLIYEEVAEFIIHVTDIPFGKWHSYELKEVIGE